MRENGFMTSAWAELRVSDVLRSKAIQTLYTARSTDRQSEVIALMKQHDISQVPVVDDGRLVGIVTEVELLDHLLTSDHIHQPDETIKALISPQVETVAPEAPLETLMSLSTTRRVVLVLDGERPVGIITKIDLLDFMTGQGK
jgi:cystathionine beta-synthase